VAGTILDENAGCPLNHRSNTMQKRRRFKQKTSLSDRLASFAKSARERAAQLTPGVERDDLLRKARQADTASHLEEWVNSPGLQPPE